MLNDKKILVTGAYGFIGRYVTKELLNDGYQVRTLSRHKKTSDTTNLENYIGDLKDPESIKIAVDGVDAVIHLAALKIDEKDIFDVNVTGTENLIQACKEKNVKYILNISSSSTKIKNKGQYAETKNKADEIVIKSGLQFTILKPSIVYSDLIGGVFASIAKFAKLPITPVIGNGKCKFWPIHTEDLAKIIKLTIENPHTINKMFDVGGSEEISINEIIQKISKIVFDKKTILVHIPKSIGMFMAKIFKLIFTKPPITESNILGSTQDIDWNQDEILNILNFKPRTLDTGLKEVKKEYHKQEANIVLKYIFSVSNIKYKNNEILEDRYRLAIKNNNLEENISYIILEKPFFIGPLDAITKIFFPDCDLQKRIQIGVTLAECDTQSASWLLPKNRKFFIFFIQITKQIIRASTKIIFGVFLLVIPGFIKKHAR